jgi:hypothetical protein
MVGRVGAGGSEVTEEAWATSADAASARGVEMGCARGDRRRGGEGANRIEAQASPIDVAAQSNDDELYWTDIQSGRMAVARTVPRRCLLLVEDERRFVSVGRNGMVVFGRSADADRYDLPVREDVLGRRGHGRQDGAGIDQAGASMTGDAQRLSTRLTLARPDTRTNSTAT